MLRDVLRVILLTVFALAAGVVSYVGLFIAFSMQCYESCLSGPHTEGWWHYMDSWQWTAVQSLAVVMFLTLLAVPCLAVDSRRRRWAYIATGLNLVSGLGLAYLVGQAHDPGTTVTGHPVRWMTSLTAAAAAAAVMALEARRRFSGGPMTLWRSPGD
jgi:hypothetical protein